VRVEAFDRDPALDEGVLTLVDGAHAALAELLHDLVLVLEHHADARVGSGLGE
jgi:hypothetical protein